MRDIASGRHYQTEPLSSVRVAWTARNKTAIRCHGATSISTICGFALGPAAGNVAVSKDWGVVI